MQKTVTVDEARQLAKQERSQRKAARRREEQQAKAARRERLRPSTEPVRVRLPFPPGLNHYYETAAYIDSSGKPIAITYISTEGKWYRKRIIELWQEVGITFSGRLAIRITAVFPDKRERDIDGLQKALFDALEHAGAFENDSQVKLLIVEQEAIEPPGWVDITLGPKPGERQGTLFDTKW